MNDILLPVDETERLAERAYSTWCAAQGATPKPWHGPNALPDNRKQPWRATVTILANEAMRSILRELEARQPKPPKAMPAPPDRPALANSPEPRPNLHAKARWWERGTGT